MHCLYLPCPPQQTMNGKVSAMSSRHWIHFFISEPHTEKEFLIIIILNYLAAAYLTSVLFTGSMIVKQVDYESLLPSHADI